MPLKYLACSLPRSFHAVNNSMKGEEEGLLVVIIGFLREDRPEDWWASSLCVQVCAVYQEREAGIGAEALMFPHSSQD